MRRVKFLDEQVQKNLKPTEFTHFLHSDAGYKKSESKPSDYEEIIYLGKCKIDGDMFCAKTNGGIVIFKGHLNDGVY